MMYCKNILVKPLDIINKEKTNKGSKAKRKTAYSGKRIKLAADFLKATCKTWQQQISIFKRFKDKKCELNILHPSKLSLKDQCY